MVMVVYYLLVWFFDWGRDGVDFVDLFIGYGVKVLRTFKGVF